MITDHVWRPTWASGKYVGTLAATRPCQYMNCRRPRAEHKRAGSLHPTALQ